MAEKSLFFNALPDSESVTGYDRNYNGDDLSDWLSVVWENGVVKDGLKVVATTGMTINVETGRAAIKGKAYINNSPASFTVETAPTGSQSRYDMIVLRFDNNVSQRTIELQLRTGQTFATTPTDAQFLSQMTRTNTVYELLLGYVRVDPNITTITQGHIGDRRANETLCGWFTAVKGYEDYYDAVIQRYERMTQLSTATDTVSSTIASNLYNSNYSLLTIYTNGIKENETSYIIITSGSYIQVRFTTQRASGTKVTFVLENFIDGEGLSTAINSYNAWVSDVEVLKDKNEYTYVCNGVNDNILIGNMVRAFLGGGSDYASAKIKVIGNIGIAAAAGGDGSVSNPCYWFNFNTGGNRHCIVDFSCAGEIRPTIANGTSNIIFYSNNDIDIIGARVIASNKTANTVIRVLSTTYGAIYFEKCYFNLEGYQDTCIATRGTFTDCRGYVSNEINNGYCFLNNSTNVIKLNGGEYYSYVKDANVQSAVVGQSGTTSITILYGVNCPTVTKSGYRQTHCILQFAGGGMLNCTDIISTLTMSVVSGISNIRGTISMNKSNVM